MKDRITEIAIIVIGAIGLIIVFTVFYGIPKFLFDHIAALLRTIF